MLTGLAIGDRHRWPRKPRSPPSLEIAGNIVTCQLVYCGPSLARKEASQATPPNMFSRELHWAWISLGRERKFGDRGLGPVQSSNQMAERHPERYIFPQDPMAPSLVSSARIQDLPAFSSLCGNQHSSPWGPP